jgi:hypothetical protein
MKYVMVFESDNPELEGDEVQRIEALDPASLYSIKVSNISNCFIRKLPPRAICNDYNFESYTNGLAKGMNYILDKLEGKNGEYDFEDLIPIKEEK